MNSPVPHSDQVVGYPEHRVPRSGVAITITTRTLWVAALIVLVILVALFLILRAQEPIVLLVLSIILGEGIRPLVVRLKRYHIPGPVAVLLIYLALLLVVGVLLWLLLSPLLSEVSALVRDLPRYLAQLQQDMHRLEQSLRAQEPVNSVLNSLSTSLDTLVRNSIPTLLAVPVNALSGLVSLFIDVVIVLTMALFWQMSSAKLKAFVVGLFPAQSQEHASLVIGEMGRGFGGYVRGILFAMVTIGLLVTLGLTFLGVPFALLLGFLAGFTELIPYVGPWISGTIAALVALVAVDPAKALQVIILFFIIFAIEGELAQPLVMSRAVRIDPLVALVSVLIGLSLLGIPGAILAVPLAACVQVLVVRVLAPTVRNALDKPDQAELSSLAAGASAPADQSVPTSSTNGSTGVTQTADELGC
jgi:predicted PurR-regulated permease PerM